MVDAISNSIRRRRQNGNNGKRRIISMIMIFIVIIFVMIQYTNLFFVMKKTMVYYNNNPMTFFEELSTSTPLPLLLETTLTVKERLMNNNYTTDDGTIIERECSDVFAVGNNLSSSLPSSSMPLMKPMWVPSYPGSGAEMFRALVEATTGYNAAELYVYQACSKPGVITCKTHWPSIPNNPQHPKNRMSMFHNRSFFLIRNPRNALPSYFNHLWEQRKRKKYHSRQAPLLDWQQWRNKNFHNQIYNWKNMISSWADANSNPYQLIYIQYEKLTNKVTGPELLENAIMNELRQVLLTNNVTYTTTTTGTGTNLLSSSSSNNNNNDTNLIPCLWYKVIKGKESSTTKRATHNYKPPFTLDQKKEMLEMLDGAIEEFSSTSVIMLSNNSNTTATNTSSYSFSDDQSLILLEILTSYRNDIALNTPLDDDNDYGLSTTNSSS